MIFTHQFYLILRNLIFLSEFASKDLVRLIV